MTRPILVAPHGALRTVCPAALHFDQALADLTQEMFAAMYAALGRGLAAPQIGVLLRVFVMDVTWKTVERSPKVFVNPQVIKADPALVVNEESCLSIPRLTVAVPRPTALTLRWQGLDSEYQTGTFTGTEAVIVQHERDHLDGVLCTDYGTLM